METAIVVQVIIGVVLAVLNGVVIWSYQSTKGELQQLKNERLKTMDDAIREKCSRARAQELERRVCNLENVGLNEQWTDSLKLTLESFRTELQAFREFVGESKKSFEILDKIERRLNSHIDNHH